MIIINLLKKIYMSIYKTHLRKKVLFGRRVCIGRQVVFEGGNALSDDVLFVGNSFIGYGSYIGPKTRLFDVEIGRYTCIGSDVTMIVGRHPTSKFVSIHPAFFSLKKQSGFTYVSKQKFNENSYSNSNKSVRITIGNDVWIGSKVTIMEGVKIGDGSIIAACAVVTKDIEPYTIVGGCPAKVIRKRFPDDEIDLLLKEKWWEKPETWIADNSDVFDDIVKFKEMIRNETLK